MASKLLPLTVCRNAHGDLTMEGVSGTECKIYVFHASGWIDPETVDDSLKFTLSDRGRGYFAAIPLLGRPDMVGPMFGGNLAYIHDSRSVTVAFVHDRWEKP